MSVERITYKDASENWTISCHRFENYFKLKLPAHLKGEAVDRLAAYEETGLSPDEVIELKGRVEGLCK